MRWWSLGGPTLWLVVTVGGGICAAQTDDKSAVSPQVISVPDGPGTIEGLGESFQPQYNTGLASYRVPIELPQGVAGHTPELSLDFNAGFGNGCVGLGWRLGGPAIRRQADKGQPLFSDADRFIDRSGEELVPLQDGTYRRKNELDRSFSRIARFDEGWRIEHKSGMTLLLGQYPSASDPARISRTSRSTPCFGSTACFDDTYEWCVDEVHDVHGNVIEYFYETLPESPGVIFLSRIEYARNGAHRHEVEFGYEARPDRAVFQGGVFAGGLADYRTGYERVWGQRLAEIRVLSGGAMVRKYELSYDDLGADSPVPRSGSATLTETSRLAKVTLYDSSEASYRPAIRFAYQSLVLDDTTSSITSMGGAPWNLTVPGSVHNGVDLFDVDFDGRPDLVNGAAPGGWIYARNLPGPTLSFGSSVAMTNSPAYSLSSPGTKFLDVNGDVLPDLVTRVGSGIFDNIYVPCEPNGTWQNEQTFLNNPPSPFSYDNPAVGSLDVDFDKDLDLLYLQGGGVTAWLQEDGVWTQQSWSAGSAQVADLDPTVSLDSPWVHLADMNGDRLLDVVRLQTLGAQLTASYWPNRGRGQLDFERTLAPVVYPGTVPEFIQVRDTTNDGLADILYVENLQVTIFVNRGDGTFAPAVILGAPARNASTALRFADMDANGTLDLLYNEGSTWQVLRPIPGGVPYQLIAIDNGIGLKTRIDYQSVSDYEAEAIAAGRPWDVHVPIPMQVVQRYRFETGLELDEHSGPDEYISEVGYRDGYYDANEKEFRGFAFVEITARGDDYFSMAGPFSGPTQTTRVAYWTGAPDGVDNDGDGLVDEYHPENGQEEEALKGKKRWEETTVGPGLGTESYPYDEGDYLPDSQVFRRTSHCWRILRTHAASGAELPVAPLDSNLEVHYPILEKTLTEEVERGALPSVHKLECFTYDPYGNTLEKGEFGVVDPTNLPPWPLPPGGTTGFSGTHDDERITRWTYDYNETAWIMDRPSLELVTDEEENWVRREENDYDVQGRVIQTRDFVSEGGPVYHTGPNVYDAFGNLIEKTNARGFTQFITYDPDYHTYPIRESYEVAGVSTCSGANTLTAEAVWDPAFGTLLSYTDFNGAVSVFDYDSFGRLVAVVRPGDTGDLPTTLYRYRAGDAHRGLFYHYDRDGVLTLESGVIGPAISLVETEQRERFGATGTVVSREYTDGRGETLARWIEHESGFAVEEAFLYDARGQVRAELLPYLAPGPDYEAPAGGLAREAIRHDSTGREIHRILPPDTSGVEHHATTEYQPLVTLESDFEDTLSGGPHEGTLTRRVQDGLGRLREVDQQNLVGAVPGPLLTTFAYDLNDNCVQIVDANGNTKVLDYDGLSRLTLQGCPDAGITTYEYDENSNLVLKTDGLGRTTEFSHDGLDRMCSEDYLDGPGGTSGGVDVRYFYDEPFGGEKGSGFGRGRLTHVEDLSGSESNEYDARGNVVARRKSIVGGDGTVHDYHVAFSFDSMDRPVWNQFVDGQRAFYRYNERGLLGQIVGIVDDVTYEPSGKVSSMQFGNGDVRSYAYDARTRMVGVDADNVGGQELERLGFEYDGVDSIVEISDARAALGFQDPRSLQQDLVYDDLYRLVSAQGEGYGSISYAYDKVGNMLSRSSPDVTDPAMEFASRAYGGLAGSSGRGPRLPGEAAGPHSLTSFGGLGSIGYDDVGNVITADGQTYVWDFKNRMVEAHPAGSPALNSALDYSDRRVLRSSAGDPSSEVHYVDAANEIREGSVVKHFIVDSQRVCQVTGGLPTSSQTVQIEVLEEGWNLIDLSVEPASLTVDDVFAGVSGLVESVARLDGVAYQTACPGCPGNEFTELEAGRPYWVRVSESCVLELTGTPASALTTSISPGWNLVVAPAGTTVSPETWIGDCSGAEAVFAWGGEEKTWTGYSPSRPAFANDLSKVVGGRPYLVFASGPCSPTGGSGTGVVLWYHPDQLGGTHVVTDAAGNTVREMAYYPYGQVRYEHVFGSGVKVAYAFSGKERDESTGLIDFGARFYSAMFLHWLSMDPFVTNVSPESSETTRRAPKKLNGYVYTGLSPVSRVDPDGRDDIKTADAVSFGVQRVFQHVDLATARMSDFVGAAGKARGAMSAAQLLLAPAQLAAKAADGTTAAYLDRILTAANVGLSAAGLVLNPSTETAVGFSSAASEWGGQLRADLDGIVDAREAQAFSRWETGVLQSDKARIQQQLTNQGNPTAPGNRVEQPARTELNSPPAPWK